MEKSRLSESKIENHRLVLLAKSFFIKRPVFLDLTISILYPLILNLICLGLPQCMPTSVHTHIAYISDLRIAPKLKQSHPKPTANLISFHYPNHPRELKNHHQYIVMVTCPWVFAKLSALIRLNPCHLCSTNKLELKSLYYSKLNSEN